LTFVIRTPILCCTTTDLGISAIFSFFGTVVGIFGVAFVRALLWFLLGTLLSPQTL